MEKKSKKGTPRVPASEETVSYGPHHLNQAALHAIHLMNRTWFDGLFAPDAQFVVSRLLLGVYICWGKGIVPTKQEATAYMGTVDARTSQKYIDMAITNKLLYEKRSESDKRIYYICPTDRFFSLMDEELSSIATDMRLDVDVMATLPLPPIPQRVGDQRHTEYLLMNESDLGHLVDDTYPRMYVDNSAAERRINRIGDFIRMFPDRWTGYHARFFIYMIAEKNEFALSDINKVLELAGPIPGILAQRGIIHHRLGNIDLALNDFTAALTNDEHLWQTYIVRGGLYCTLKQFDAAILDFSKAIEILSSAQSAVRARNLANVYRNRAFAYEAQGDTESANADRQKAEEYSPSTALEIELGKKAIAAARSMKKQPAPNSPAGGAKKKSRSPKSGS